MQKPPLDLNWKELRNMFEKEGLRRATCVSAILVIIGAVVTRYWFGERHAEIQVPDPVLASLSQLPPEACAPILTDLQERWPADLNVRQILMLQAAPGEAPMVVATTEDSSDEEGATHWHSPWPAVNKRLLAGRLDQRTSVRGNHGGVSYRHSLIPVDETGSRLLLVNQGHPVRSWSISRWLVVFVATLLLIGALTYRR